MYLLHAMYIFISKNYLEISLIKIFQFFFSTNKNKILKTFKYEFYNTIKSNFMIKIKMRF